VSGVAASVCIKPASGLAADAILEDGRLADDEVMVLESIHGP
jgi:hypothetical protein